MKNKSKLLVTSLALFLSANTYATSISLSVEEQRLTEQHKYDATLVNAKGLSDFAEQWLLVKEYTEAKQLLHTEGTRLWSEIKSQVKSHSRFDDRPLYWQRLAIKAHIKKQPLKFSEAELASLLEVFENVSRGYADIDYRYNTAKQIFITGFDPFLLDKNIGQSNPSGLAALSLDGKVIELNGVKAEINAVIVPVRYEDFDNGEIESLLAPIYLGGNVDLVSTVSMGREHFDLERFPGKRRSVTAPDNLNVLSGGTKEAPIISKLAGETLSGDEFVEFSLPVTAMQKAKGKYQVIDNLKVVTLEKGELQPKLLAELDGQTAVSGGGGGYLSNEISYRSIRLQNQLGTKVPTGHIHTPRIKEFDNETNKAIVNQIEEMLKQAIAAI
ncbi:hypothetical protein [Pseudoalteromonas sp. G4]|uniref:hypothetical protein n=1 Tax=Pseudoalteromonas sp. G4 TaxID=2992761 RepID=UPI00237DDCF0|nr:hypothetical protein [Pseudoalteromonas sp. G4]MDE3273610.1 hypothetical protein [Pseudoalteromonas sp. G4]